MRCCSQKEPYTKGKDEKYKTLVGTKDSINELLEEIQKDSEGALIQYIANRTADAKNDSQSQRLISFLEAEIRIREITSLSCHRWIVSIATIVIAIMTVVNILIH